jgi:hypothetical protein
MIGVRKPEIPVEFSYFQYYFYLLVLIVIKKRLWRAHFLKLYRTLHQEFPPGCRDADHERRIKAAYPIHPANVPSTTRACSLNSPLRQLGTGTRKGYRRSELLAFTPRRKLNRLVDEVRAEIHPFCPLRDTFPQNGQHNLKPTTIDRYLGIIDLPTLLYFTPL